MTVIEAHGQTLLQLLRSRPGWHSRRELAQFLGKKQLTVQHQAGLELLIVQGRVSVRSTVGAVGRHTRRLEYTAIDAGRTE